MVEAADYSGLFTHNGSCVRVTCQMGHFQANKGSCVREQAATISHNWATGNLGNRTGRERTVRTLFAPKWGAFAV
ncbi:hypothetical protein [Paenibacillus marinisediminis]